MSKPERMSSVDTTWLRMDRTANPMVINSVLVFEGPVDLDALEETIAERFLAIPRLRQHVEIISGDYWWVDDPYFDRTRHIKRARLPGKGGKAELQRYVAELASERMDKSRPLWEMRIVEDYEGGAAVITRFHHAIADGMALVAMMLSVTDGGDPGIWSSRPSKPPKRSWLPAYQTVLKTVGTASGLLKKASALASNPAQTVRLGAGVAGELAWLMLMPEDSWTRFKGKPSGNKRVAWTDPIPMTEVKAVSKALGCTINDMLLASVAGALCEYLKDKGDKTHGVEIRALVPVDQRHSYEMGQLGNKFGIVGVELPVGVENPLARLMEVRRRMQDLKTSLEPPVTLSLFDVLGHAPKIAQDKLFDLMTHRATAVMTNVPGPAAPMYMAGAKIKQIMFWVPQSCDIGMGVSILSYNGMVQFGLITDAEMVPDPEAIVAHFRPKFEQLLYYALMSSWDDRDNEAPVHTYAQREEAPPPAAKTRKPRAKKPAERKPEPEPEPAPVEAPPAVARKPRAASKPRTRGEAAKPAAPAKSASVARRKLPRT
jgi:diacylglycerol O-acyltransferase